MNRLVENMFSVSAGRYEREQSISDQEIHTLDNIEYLDNKNNVISLSKQILNDEAGLSNIKSFCQACVDDYYNNVLKYTAKLYIHLSWVNINNYNDFHHRHYHPNSVISGTFYFHDTQDNPVKVYNPNISNRAYHDVPTEDNTYNNMYYSLPAKRNTCLVFPSWIEHEVMPNKKQNTSRVTIAFNAFFKPNQDLGIDATALRL